MKSNVLAACGVLLSLVPALAADPGGVTRVALSAYHKDAEKNEATLRLVYFHPKGVKPQKDYQGRITRIMFDIRSFLDVEMERHGFKDAVLPLEMDGKQVKLHMVEGKEGAEGYSHEAGRKVKAEMREALKESFDLDEEFVLVFHGMCRIEGERKYHFYAPYYGDGGSNHQWGLCHVADCEILDPALLEDTKRRMSYTEHYGEYEQSVAGFNTKYLGGTAHELGHGLSLPHNSQTRKEKRELGTALMGAGNHTYRQEKWTDKKGSFLTLSSAIRLAAHPLFTQSDRGREVDGKSQIGKLEFAGEGSELLIKGKFRSEPKAHAMIAYLDPDGGGDYDAVTTTTALSGEDFEIQAECLKPGPHKLRLVFCHPNGATSQHAYKFEADKNLEPDREGIEPLGRGRRR